jgi:recombination protein RecA
MMATAEKEKLTLDDMLKKGIIKYGSDPSLEVKFVKFGIPQLDDLLGFGLPRGRAVLFVGDYSSGKTFLAQQAMARVQAEGGTAAYVDAERSYDEKWFRASGVDTDKLLVSVPEYGEKAVDVCVALIEAKVDIVVLDSIAALIPFIEVEEDSSAEQQLVGTQPRLVASAFRRFTVANTDSIFIGINQIAKGIGQYAPETLPGGKKQQFASHIILRLNREQWITEGSKKKRVGFDIHMVAIKNKMSRPFGECTIPFYFNGEFDDIITNIDFALSRNIIKQAGPYYKFGDIKSLGKAALKTHFKDHPEDYQRLITSLGKEAVDDESTEAAEE